MRLSWRWKWVISIRVSFSNSTIASVNVQFSTLTSSDITGSINGFTLCIEIPRNTIRTRFTHSPFTVSGHNMLNFTGHYSLSNSFASGNEAYHSHRGEFITTAISGTAIRNLIITVTSTKQRLTPTKSATSTRFSYVKRDYFHVLWT